MSHPNPRKIASLRCPWCKINKKNKPHWLNCKTWNFLLSGPLKLKSVNLFDFGVNRSWADEDHFDPAARSPRQDEHQRKPGPFFSRRPRKKNKLDQLLLLFLPLCRQIWLSIYFGQKKSCLKGTERRRRFNKKTSHRDRVERGGHDDQLFRWSAVER